MVFVAYQLCAVPSLMYLVKPQAPESGNKLIGGDIFKESWVRSSKNRNLSLFLGHDLRRLLAAVCHHFGFLGTDRDAFTAANAAGVNYFNMGGAHSDSLDRTVAHAGVTFTTTFFYGFNWSHRSVAPEFENG